MPEAHAVEHVLRMGVQARLAGGQRLHQVPGTLRDLRVVRCQQVAQAGTFDIVGRHTLAKTRRLGAQQCRQRGVRARHLACGQAVAVVDQADRLVGGGIGLVFPHRPARQAGGMRADMARRMAVVDELDLQVHGRTPQHVGAASAVGQEDLHQLRAAELDIVHHEPTVAGLEVFDQRLHPCPVGGGQHPHRARCRGAGQRQAQRRGTGRAGAQQHASPAVRAVSRRGGHGWRHYCDPRQRPA
ncbi:MAG: hypothetical protein IPI51_01310 [Betaproteobacteria bacterium]|nr:hypothetical protein [Betaproteobacteria bacterium]